MPSPNRGPRMGGSPAHERLMLANLCTQLLQNGRITTTESKAKRLRPHVEKLITFGRRGDLHARRQVLKVIRDKTVVHTLFADIGPGFANRPGGYTRIIKLGPRKGDNAPMALIELVEALTVSQQAVGEAERARGTRSAAPRPVTGATRESAEALAGQSPTAAGVAQAAGAADEDAGRRSEASPATVEAPADEPLPTSAPEPLAADDGRGQAQGRPGDSPDRATPASEGNAATPAGGSPRPESAGPDGIEGRDGSERV